MAGLFKKVFMPKETTPLDAQGRLVPSYANYLGAIEPMSAALSAFDPDTFEADILAAVTTATSFLQNRAYVEYALSTNITVPAIPADDTIPQITEGIEILTLSLTPTSVTARLRVSFAGFGSAAIGGVGAPITAALFVNGGTSAVQMTQVFGADGASPQQLALDYEYLPGVTTAQTIAIRVGPATTGTLRMNGIVGARRGGGAAKSTLIASQITA